MPIQITTDLITILGALFGIIGVLIAIFQTISARRAKKIYQSYCRNKCKQIVSLNKEMSEEVIDACNVIENSSAKEKTQSNNLIDPKIILAAKINGIRLLTRQLGNYCESVNDEHKDQFGQEIFKDINKEIPQKECLSKALRRDQDKKDKDKDVSNV